MAKAGASQKKAKKASEPKVSLPTSGANLSALSIVEAEERAQQPKQGSRRLRKRNTEETVCKSLRDNFSGWDAASTDHFLVEGLSLRQVLSRDRRLVDANDAAAPRLGKRYYESLRERFSPENHPCKRLRPTNDQEVLDPQLERGLIAMNQHMRKFDLMLEFLDRGKLVNQLSLVVLFKHTLKISPKANKDALQYLMSFLRYCGRHGIPTKYAEEWSHMRSHMDETLLRSWLGFKSSGLSAERWWDSVRPAAKLILEERLVQDVLSLGGDENWCQVEMSLASIVSASAVGKALFGAAFAKLLRGRASAVVSSRVTEIFSEPVTQESLDRHRDAFILEMKRLGRDPAEAQTPHEVSVRYRGALVTATVTSALDEYCLKVDAAVRGSAVAGGQLKGLFCEDSLVPDAPDTGTATQVDEGLLVANQKARAAAEDLMRGKVQSGTAIKDTLLQHRTLLLQIDRSFRLEIDFWCSVSGDRAEKRLLDEVLVARPKVNESKSATEALAALAKLGNSRLLEFSGVSLQATFRSVVGVVEAIAAGRAPGFDGSNLSPFMRAVMESASLFCKHEEAGSAGAATIMYGKPAAHKLYESLKAKDTAGTAITLRDLSALVPFQWLVAGSVSEDLKKWTAKAAAKDLVAGAAEAIASSTGKLGSRGAGRKKTSSDARSLVLACLND